MSELIARALKWLFAQIEAWAKAPPAAAKPALAETPRIKGLVKVCADAFVTKGIDVSHWQPEVDWAQVKRQGFQFAFIKASEGLAYVDKSFDSHWANAKEAGLIRGAYHFFRPKLDPIEQARLLWRMVEGRMGEEDLPCVLDWEALDGIPTEHAYDSGLKFLREIERLSGRKPIVYTGPYFIQALKPTMELAQYPLWIAHYGPKCPLVPFPWPKWTFWQTSGSMKIAGIPGPVDADLFNGTVDDLKAFVRASSL